MSEQELAQAVVAWLADGGWDVYQEVEVGRGGRRCDVVAVKGRTLWAIECKASLGLAVLGQAHAWHGHAHRISVATRAVKSAFGAEVARAFGIGWLVVSSGRGRSGRAARGRLVVRQRLAPARQARISRRLSGALCAEQRSFAPAGNARAQFWSPWKGTAAAVRAWVAEHPGGRFADMIGSVQHHYRTQATARSCLRRHIEDGLVAGVRLGRRGGRLVLIGNEPAADAKRALPSSAAPDQPVKPAPCPAPPAASGPKASGPKASGPKASGPKASGPKASGPKASGPKASGPKAVVPPAPPAVPGVFALLPPSSAMPG